MIYIFFKGENKTPLTITEPQLFGLKKLKQNPKNITFEIGVKEYLFSDIWFIGSKCHNKRCSSPIRAHGLNDVCDFEITGHCQFCRKKVTEKSKRYTLAKFNSIACCYEHTPIGKLYGRPKTQRDAFVHNRAYMFMREGYELETALQKAEAMYEVQRV